ARRRPVPSVLAAAAERRHEAARLDLADPPPAARAGRPARVVDGEEVADLLLKCRWNALALHGDRVGHRRLRRRVEAVDLLRGQRRPPPVWPQAGALPGVVAVGIADPRDERLVLQQVLQLAGRTLDPGPPRVE